MSVNESDKLRRRFLQFWEYVDREIAVRNLPAEPLVRAQENWESWWESKLSSDDRREIEQLGATKTAQESLAQWAEDWLEKRFKRRGAGRLVLAQLTQTAPFSNWPEWNSYRRGTNALILKPSAGRWSPADVKPLITIAVERYPDYQPADLDTNETLSLANSQADYYQLNVEIREETASRNARDASESAFRGIVFVRFAARWVLYGRKRRRPWIRKLLGACWTFTAVAWLSILGLLSILSRTNLFTYFPDDELLIPCLSLLVIVPLLAFIYILVANAYECLQAARCGKRWAKLLRRSQLYLLVGNWQTAPKLKVNGASFGLMLALRNLLALYEVEPHPLQSRREAEPSRRLWRRVLQEVAEQPSWLWQQFFEEMCEAVPRFSGTGEITSSGWNERVERMPDKIAASRAHPEITEMLTPFQNESSTQFRPSVTDVGSTEDERQAAGVSRLRIRRCADLASAMLTVGNLVNRRSKWGTAIIFLILAFVVGIALPEVISIYGAALPQPVNYQVFNSDPRFQSGDRFLLISVETDSPDEFEIIDQYQHRTARLKRILDNTSITSADPSISPVATARFELNSESPSVLIELRRHRSLFGLSLPDKPVLVLPIR